MSQSMEFKNGSEYVKGKLKEMNQLLPVVRKYTQICSKLHASMDLLTETKSFYNVLIYIYIYICIGYNRRSIKTQIAGTILS